MDVADGPCESDGRRDGTCEPPAGMEVAVLACGCFWGAEKGFWRLPGVHNTKVGYAGGTDDSPPTYERVCAGLTGHAEAVRIIYDPIVISFADILRWFWQCHDPTQADGQGNDRGRQYRSAIFCTSDQQLLAVRETRSAYQRLLRVNGVRSPIVTEVKPLQNFYSAEAAHQQYLARPDSRPYCSARPLMMRCSAADWRCSLPLELAPRLGESFWTAHAPTHRCALTLPNEQIIWDHVIWDAPPPPAPQPVQGSEELMVPKAHGTCARGVQQQLRWGCDRATSDRICCFNRRFAERRGYWQTTRLHRMCSAATPPSSSAESTVVLTFFDSVHGLPCYQVGGSGRTWAMFERESREHGWPSFRDTEVIWQNVRVLPDGEVVSTGGVHLGHNLADMHGNRHCINLVSIAGRPMVPCGAAAAVEGAATAVQAAEAAAVPRPSALGSGASSTLAAPSSESASANDYDGPWHDLPPVAIVPLSGEATVVCHEHHCVADGIAEVVRSRLGPRAVVVRDWHADVSASAVLFIVEVERDGTSCDAARKFLRQLTKSPATLFGDAELATKAVGVLGLARSVCSFSAASGGADKFAGAARLQARLVSAGCELLVPMGMSEVELEGVEVAVLPWADAAARAFEELIARRLDTLFGRGLPPSVAEPTSVAEATMSRAADPCATEHMSKADGDDANWRAGAGEQATERSAVDDPQRTLPSEILGHRVLSAAVMLAAGSLLMLSVRACRRMRDT